jgi:phosphatidyl-myo-inositol dimannoside synthase
VSAPKHQSSGPQRDLVFVSAGLDLDGGGRALAGRLLARTCAELAAERGTGCEILALGRSGSPAPARYFGADQRGLALAAWRRQLGRRRVALVFDLLGPARVQAWLPAPLCAPYLLPLYGIEVWRQLGWERRRALARAAVRLAISRYTVERARPFCPDLGGVRILPLALEERTPEGAVDLDLISHLGTGFLLIVGRMAPAERYKGHDEILEALPRLPGARLVVAGDGGDRPRLEARAQELGLRGRATFTGFVSEATLAELYRRSAAFVMPSLGEGFGLVYLEAMRAGKPVVAARGSAAEEVVVHEETGFLVDRGDPAELVAVLGRLLASPDLARRQGEAGRRRWRDQFSLEKFQAGLRPLLDELSSSPSPAPRGRGPGGGGA